ncbi:MAG: amylo-alpha-1,6-glucosidase [Vampirovibrionia bacterium]
MYINHMATLLQSTLDNKLLVRDEWLDTNGLGSYSSSSIENCNTRRYHGLLVCRQPGFEHRFVLLSKFDETVFIGDEEFYLSKNYFSPGVVVPDQEKLLNLEFNQELNPKWIFRNHNSQITKELLMVYGQDITLIKYTYENLSRDRDLNLIYLNLRPFLAFRNFNHLSKENETFNFDYSSEEKTISYKPYSSLSELKISLSEDFKVEEFSCWYENFLYPEELERGYDYEEDLACPGVISLKLESKKSIYIAVHNSGELKKSLKSLWSEEFSRRAKLIKSNNLKNTDMLSQLTYSANQFLIKSKNDTYSIIAGYHWFGEWGRDTMISLPGILLETSLEKEFTKVFKRFLDFKQDGLIPNMIGDDVEHSAYNSVDASLWLFWALQQFYYKKKCSLSLIKKEFWEDLKDIINAYVEGRSTHLKFNDLGLIESGTEQDSLTWMDARVNGLAVTPRRGMLVEINALWFNALSFVEELATEFKDPFKDKVSDLKDKVKANYMKVFWLEEKGYLADYVLPTYVNGSHNPTLIPNKQLRPNQLLAISLEYSPLGKFEQVSLVRIVEEELLTPFGLRTLNKADSQYKGHYEGDVNLRDAAYHNGTVWTWLLGPFFDALLKTTDNLDATKKRIRTMINYFDSHLKHGGYYSVSEIFDGDEPHAPRGCIAQAWSVAELRRILLQVDR